MDEKLIEIEKDTGFKMIQGIIKQIFFSVNRKRQKGYYLEIKNNYSELTVSAKETINAFDYQVFSAIASYVNKNLQKIVDNDEVAKEVVGKTKEEIKSNTKISIIDKQRVFERNYVVEFQLYDFIKNYMHRDKKSISRKVYDLVIASIERLQTLNIRVVSKTDKEEMRFQLSPIPFVEITKNKKTQKESTVRIGLSFLFLYLLAYPRALYINNKYIQKPKSDIAVALVNFLQTTTSNTYSLSFLTEHLHLEKAKENRTILRGIRKAFSELTKIGYLEYYKENKREDDIYFTFKRKSAENTLNVNTSNKKKTKNKQPK